MNTRIAVAVFLFAFFAGFVLVGTIGATNPKGTANPVFGLGLDGPRLLPLPGLREAVIGGLHWMLGALAAAADTKALARAA